MRRALIIDEKSFGPEHPNVAIGLSNLAQLLQATNRLAEAEPLMRRALAACNTAAGDKGDAEALSGLARAFFYAKARALLVSHWYVNSEAAVKLSNETGR